MPPIHRGRAFWEATIKEYQSSGMKQKAFAESKGLKVSTLQGWLRRSRRETNAVQFIEVQQGRDTAVPSAAVHIDVPGGAVVRFDVLPPPRYLVKLVTSVSSSSRC